MCLWFRGLGVVICFHSSPSSEYHQVSIKLPFWICSCATTTQGGAIQFLQVDCLCKDNHLCSTKCLFCRLMHASTKPIHRHGRIHPGGCVIVLLNKQTLLLFQCLQDYESDRKRDISVFYSGAFPKVMSYKLVEEFIQVATLGTN